MTQIRSLARRRACLYLAATLASAGALAAEPFPSKPIRIIVPWSAGGGGDVVTRLIAAELSARSKVPVTVENRAGATGTIGSAHVATSPADGYTLLFGSADSQSIMPQVMKNSPYDGRKGFTAIAPIGFFPYVLAVHPSVPAATAQEFVQFARSSREPIEYGSWGVGSSGQVLAESVKAAAGINMLHVPYQGTAPVLTALVGGQIRAAILPMPLVEQYAKAGTIRLLAVTTPERLPGFPAVPTLREQGIKVDLTAWTGIMAPAQVPQGVVARLNQIVTEAISSPGVAERLRQLQIVPQTMGQPEFQRFIDNEYNRWGQVIQQANISLQ